MEDLSALSVAELQQRIRVEMAGKPGECVCPVIDGTRGFRQRCPVHGQRTREDFNRVMALRSELFSKLQAPASVKGTK